MKPEYVLVAVVTACLTAISGSPALAAPRQVEEFCFEQLQQSTLPRRRAWGEAFLANCIANLTPTPTEKAQVSYVSQVLRGPERERNAEAEAEGTLCVSHHPF